MSKDLPLAVRIAMFLAVVIAVTFVMAIFFMLASKTPQA
jgi:hypothetical protein